MQSMMELNQHQLLIFQLKIHQKYLQLVKRKKWKAAAANWMINARPTVLNPFGVQKPLDTSADKRYDEPL